MKDSNATHHTKTLIQDTDRTGKIDSDLLPGDLHSQYLPHDGTDFAHAIVFYLPTETEPIVFSDRTEINIGRQDTHGRITPELDLSGYGASEHGVSRLHAQIIWDGKQYLVQDLHSTNHTWLNGHRLSPYTFYPLTDGSTLQVARLNMMAFVVIR